MRSYPEPPTRRVRLWHIKSIFGLTVKNGPLLAEQKILGEQCILYKQEITLMYGGIITLSFSTCKLHLKQSHKVPQPVL